MTQKKIMNERFCHSCGIQLNDDNCRKVSKSASGYSYLCVDCEQQLFDRIAQTQGRYMGLFFTCLALDCPCSPIVLDGVDIDTCEDLWIAYINALAEAKQDIKRNKVLGFADGAVTALQELFGRELNHQDFVAYIAKERKAIANKPKEVGTEEQRERWGEQVLYKGLPLTKELYDELDRLYEIRANSYKGQTITPQMDDTLIKVAKSNVIYDHLMRQGLVKMALDVQKNIDLLLASEQMRKKDEKPVANFTPDAWVDAFEKAGLMQDGQFLTLHEIEDAMIKIMRGKGYEQTLDAAHQLELNIVNNARRNADQQTIFELPEDMRISDELGEFAEEQSDEEREAREYAHLTPVRFETKKDKR